MLPFAQLMVVYVFCFLTWEENYVHYWLACTTE